MKISTFNLILGLILSILQIIPISTLQSQSKNGLLHMKEGNLNNSERSFRKGQQEKGDYSASSLGIGLLFKDSSFKNYNLDSAYTYLNQYPKYWKQLNKKSKKDFGENKIDEAIFKNALDEVIEQAFQKSLVSNKIETQVHFIKFYALADEEKKAKIFQRKHELLYQSVKATKTLNAYQTFFANNESDLLIYSKKLYEIANKDALDIFLSTKKWADFAAFELLFPNSPFVKDLTKSAFIEAQQKNTVTALTAFIATYPESLFIPFAKQQLEKLEYATIRNSTDIGAIAGFLKKYKSSNFKNEIDSQLSQLIEQNLQVSAFEKHRKSIQLTDIPKTMQVIYNQYAASGYPKRLEDCVKKYPFFKETDLFKADELLTLEYKKLPIRYTPAANDQYSAYIKKAAPKQSAFSSLQKILAPAIKDGNWEVALALAQEFEDVFGEHHAAYNKLKTILASPILNNIRKQPISGQTNTENSEYSPVISIDEQSMFFCRRMGTTEAIFAAPKKGIEWDVAEKIETLVGRGNRAPLGISADGVQLLIFENGRIKIATKTAQGWTPPKPIGLHINNSKWQGGATLSSDDKVLIFAARRTEVLGVGDIDNIDLFLSFKGKDGAWQPPLNLGKTINTSFKERTPFLHPDLRTLYFSSNAHGGIGGMDVYMTTRLDDTWMKWSDPVNLGKMINTARDDWGYSISTDGKVGYFATNAEGANHQDIFTITIPEEFRPGAVSTIGGKLVNAKGEAVEATITIEDLDQQKTVAELRSDPTTGSYFAVLPEKRLYGYVVEKNGFYPASGYLDLRENSYSQRINNDYTLYTFEEASERNLALPVSNLFFETGKAIIKTASHAALNRLARLINANNLQIRVEGHTDNVGSDATNLRLSNERALAVKTYLLSQGVGTTSILSEGFGETSPIGSNETEEGRAQNRRVEIRLLKK